MKDQKAGYSGQGNPNSQNKKPDPRNQQINDDDFHSERDLERNNDNTLDRDRIPDQPKYNNPNSPQNQNQNSNDKNPNFPRNDNREDKDDEFDEDIEENDDDYLKNDQGRQRQNPTSRNTTL
ncbi:hypothetical protein [Flavobacterium sp.]|uniref:hypothetical protein n=1 Tax=Flavobacterium sp. TaxID=239 RepID=UPI00261CF390|nr:hypothetical protein [Flavobacterium sp.]